MSDITYFCRTCDICQRVVPEGKSQGLVPEGKVTRLPIGEMPLTEEPFSKVAVDLIGPLSPLSDKGNRYVLHIVDHASRYPEVVPLDKVEIEHVAEALVDVFCRVGFPKEVLSDREPQFVSDLMCEVC